MKAQNMTIDINKLDTNQLELLEEMYYKTGMMNEAKQVYNRIAFLNGYMSEAKEKEYFEKYCK